IPFIGAIYCPNQGIFPEYSDGFYCLDDTVMFISRGMGSSSFPVRIFNPPQLVIITLEHAN
ncbi:MAG: metallophosphoesterase, partial [Clostridia bacterium]|nr:metallophosphoesterase [Clostridia bacterium]